MKLTSHEKQDLRFSRRWWLAASKDLFWVGIVTVLIWVYADMEFIDTQTVSATVRLLPAERDKVVLLDDRGEEMAAVDVKLTFRATGSRTNLDRFKRVFSTPGPHFTFDVSEGREPGRQKVSAADILRTAPEREKLGIGVSSPSPREVEVDLDEVIRKPVPVHFEFEGAEPPAPEDVVVNVSRTKWERILKKTTDATRILKTEPVDLRAHDPGETVNVKAKIIPEIAGIAVTLEKPVLRLDFQMPPEAGPVMKTETLHDVEVYLLMPQAWASDETWLKYAFQPKQKTEWKIAVQVEGAADEINKLKALYDASVERRKAYLSTATPQDLPPPPLAVHAYLALSGKDKKHMTTDWTDKLILQLPEGLKLKVVSKTPTVSYKIIERNRTEGP
jgi:hypothetical protein